VEISADDLKSAATLEFTFYFTERDKWLGKDFVVTLGEAPASP
jgi:hypothetical protein